MNPGDRLSNKESRVSYVLPSESGLSPLREDALIVSEDMVVLEEVESNELIVYITTLPFESKSIMSTSL
jgi:hypothetical protein